MLAEAVHSVADTATRACCCSAASGPQRAATPEHPFGYGRDRYFYSFVVALLLFTLGSVFALYEGIEKLAHPEELTSPMVAIDHPARRGRPGGLLVPHRDPRVARAQGPAVLVAVHPPVHARRSCRSCCWRTSAR